MRQIRLGQSALQVSSVGMGTMGMGGYFQRDASRDEEMIRRLRAGFDAGINWIDTAEIYGAGHAEELVGRAIDGHRSEVIVATKFSPEHSNRRGLLAAAEGSLQRLRVEQIDLYQSHWPNPAVPFSETLEAMSTLLAQGKIRTVGLSNITSRQGQEAQAGLPAGALVSLQQQYNLADRFAEEVHWPICRRQGLTLIAYSPLLEGKIAPQDARRAQLEAMARDASLTAGQLVLAWLLRLPQVAVIPKAASPEHLAENVAAGAAVLSPETIAAVDRLYASAVVALDPDEIEVADAANRQVYRTVQEAVANAAGMKPSPLELAQEFRQGEPCKPLKVRRSPGTGKAYALAEGRLRYWAWVIAHEGQKPVPCTLI